jgi:hypothetical protein
VGVPVVQARVVDMSLLRDHIDTKGETKSKLLAIKELLEIFRAELEVTESVFLAGDPSLLPPSGFFRAPACLSVRVSCR